MANYYEEKLTSSHDCVVVCIPHEKYQEFLKSLMEKNNDILSHGFAQTWEIESLRPNLKRLSKGSLSYSDFQGAYF